MTPWAVELHTASHAQQYLVGGRRDANRPPRPSSNAPPGATLNNRSVLVDTVPMRAGNLASATLFQQRFLLLLFSIFAGLALLLACIGIYGVLAYLTGQRVPDIGVRLALGASRGHVMWMVLRESLGMILLGVGVGVLGAWAAARLLIRLVEGVRSIEPSTFTLMILVLLAAAFVASFVPARRASRLDPLKALHQE